LIAKCIRIVIATLMLLAGSSQLSSPAMAGTSYMMYRITFNPYSKVISAGPFDSLTQCQSALYSQTYVPGGMWTCEITSY
jgi:hypothetical protein